VILISLFTHAEDLSLLEI